MASVLMGTLEDDSDEWEDKGRNKNMSCVGTGPFTQSLSRSDVSGCYFPDDSQKQL